MSGITELVALMARLRDPDGGCPWDREQDFSSIAPYTLEEAYEVADAIERGAMDELMGELGDLLFQVVFHARMAEEAGLFDFDQVVEGIVTKMTRRHPHVFGDDQVRDATDQSEAWERLKAAERGSGGDPSLLAGVARGLPALLRAEKMQRRAARAGFDWPRAEEVVAKIEEELAELRQAMANDDSEAVGEELGDLLFSCSNLARHLHHDAEASLRRATAKFERRFRAMETRLEEEGHWPGATPEEMERHWEAIKREE